MQKYVINGGNLLKGCINISGSKNAALPLLIASILIRGKTTFFNIPDLMDVSTLIELLEYTGANVIYDKNTKVAVIDSSNVSRHKVPYELVKKMRASFIIAGPLLAIFKRASVSLPGGCAIGTRPVDIHLKSFEKMGIKYKNYRGYINLLYTDYKNTADCEILFDFPSVGATQNIIMTAVIGKRTVRVINFAKEPEVTALIDFLNKAGADISIDSSGELVIKGVDSLKSEVSFENIPDRIEAGTFMLLPAVSLPGSEIKLNNINPSHLRNIIEKLVEAGLQVGVGEKTINIRFTDKKNPIKFSTGPHPGFPTDMQAQFCSALSLSTGMSIVEECVFENRFMHIPELVRMGADISVENNTAFIKGVKKLYGASVMASDLRAGAALVLAGLAASGTTDVSRIYHIDRGYENFELKLAGVGADIKRVSVDK
ncbi:MAG: UDP-N-acetylglucosamine 1-carboxyvinyltransferase [Candidatus Muiribacteriota bacterium]|jgi:UDP-N-acetylglucosamine 1-carboxyvinyltransferase